MHCPLCVFTKALICHCCDGMAALFLHSFTLPHCCSSSSSNTDYRDVQAFLLQHLECASQNFTDKEDLAVCLKASANIPVIAGQPLAHRCFNCCAGDLPMLSSFRLFTNSSASCRLLVLARLDLTPACLCLSH